MTSSQIKTAGISVLGFILLVGFQNCSPTNFKSAAVSSKVEVSGATGPAAVQALPPPPFILVDGTPTTTQTLPAPHTQTDSTCDGKKCAVHDDHVAHDDHIIQDDNDREEQDHEHTAKTDDDDQNIAAKSRRLCDELAKNSTALASGLNIVDNSGSIRFSSASFGKVQNNSGSVHLFGTSVSHGHVASLENNSGTTLICRLDVDSIDSSSGKVVIVDGDVGSISNVSGLILVGGNIKGSVSKTSGEIRKIN